MDVVKGLKSWMNSNDNEVEDVFNRGCHYAFKNDEENRMNCRFGVREKWTSMVQRLFPESTWIHDGIDIIDDNYNSVLVCVGYKMCPP